MCMNLLARTMLRRPNALIPIIKQRSPTAAFYTRDMSSWRPRARDFLKYSSLVVSKVWAGSKWSYRFTFDRAFTKKNLEEWKAIAKHTWEGLKTGSRLFSKNVSISYNLMHKRAKGHGLSLQEHKLLLRTFSDALKLVPFSFFIIVPFAELLLPVALWLFPNMLPSTFKELISDDSRRLRRLRAKKEMAQFFEDVIKRRDEADILSVNPDKAKELKELQDLLLQTHSGHQAMFPGSAKQLIKYSRLFREEFQLENMRLEHLQAICSLLGLSPYGFHSHIVLQLRHYTTRLLSEDKQIRWEGVDSLSLEDLKEACKARGMLVDDSVNIRQMRAMLEHWLELSSVKDMPVTLLLWSRSYAATSNPELLDIAQTDALVEDNSGVRVEKYKARVESLLNQLKELEELEMTTFNPQIIEGSTLIGRYHDSEEEQRPAIEDLLSRIAELEGAVKNKKKIIDMQNDILKQQIELIARLREMPSLNKVPRKQSKEMRLELKKMYDQFESELKQLEETIRQESVQSASEPNPKSQS